MNDTKAVWSTAFINNLPDAAFAWIEPGGEKDSEGKTVPRTLRHLPHHTAAVKSPTENTTVDKPHLRAALSRANQIPAAGRARARAHLQAHARAVLGARDDSDELVIRKDLGFEVKSIDEEGRSLRMIASTPARDSYGDVVQQYWDLSHFDRNPVVLFAHNRASGGGLFGGGSLGQAETIPVAYSRNHAVVGGRLEFEPVFSDDRANPNAERVWQGIRQGVLRASSVGFKPGKIVKEEDANGVETYYVGTPDQPNILKEISIVPLPANHEAVALDADAPVRVADVFAARNNEAPPAPGVESMEHENTDGGSVVNADPPGVLGQALETVDVAALEQRAADAEKQLGDARKALEVHEKEAAERAVAAIVGAKIFPAQRDGFLKLRRLNAALFAEITEALPALRMDEPVIPTDPIAPQPETPDESADARAARKLRA